MKEGKPQYRPTDKRSNPDDLVCPNCGNDVARDYYNPITNLIKCPECNHLFVYDENPDINNEKTFQSSKPTDKNLKSSNLFFIAFILLLLALIILAIVK